MHVERMLQSVKLYATLWSYGIGTFQGGKGPSAADLQKRRYAQQRKRADAYIDELDKIAQTTTATFNQENRALPIQRLPVDMNNQGAE